MATEKNYQVSYRIQGSGQWQDAPFGDQLETALRSYLDLEERPKEDVDLSVAERDGNGEWSILDDTDFPKFLMICRELWMIPVTDGGMYEVKCIQRYQ